MIQWITRSKIGQIAIYNIVTYIICSLWPCTVLSVSLEVFYSASKINLSNKNLLAYKSISLKFCSLSDVVQIIYHQQNFIVFEIQDKQFSSHYPAVWLLMYVAGYILRPSTNVILLDNTLKLTLWNGFYYKRCLYQTISISRCHNRFGSCAEVLIVAFTL